MSGRGTLGLTLLSAALLAGGCVDGPKTPPGNKLYSGPEVVGDSAHWPVHASKPGNPSAAYRWVDLIQEASARRVDRVGARPTIIAREMMIACTAMYDA
ncbi:MAG TPA: hypothetical protein VJB14_02530, partial [Planctomycetota bacterium]|nr:hypothetical protein [Planctomycetota bacterium]